MAIFFFVIGLEVKRWISEKQLGGIFQRTGHFLQGDGWGASGGRYATLRQTEVATQKALSPLERFEAELHPWVGFVIMPIFALANAGVSIQISDFTNPVATAVGLGLLAGKPIGIVLFSWLAVKIGLARLPVGINWGVITGGGFLAGIGFTMAIFIASLALEDALLDAAQGWNFRRLSPGRHRRRHIADFISPEAFSV